MERDGRAAKRAPLVLYPWSKPTVWPAPTRAHDAVLGQLKLSDGQACLQGRIMYEVRSSECRPSPRLVQLHSSIKSSDEVTFDDDQAVLGQLGRFSADLARFSDMPLFSWELAEHSGPSKRKHPRDEIGCIGTRGTPEIGTKAG
ncbi:hypothetical protein SAMD00023353_0103980 [Rosellinia necatrix]|uniref:Uncharacterized protein n=1 Tax=Rosellinia necatrix TaxID=77044 RepID=A0A1S8A4R3_ROSNE|nr:hypothetical protein SAMD00023353_0103980 [Rosellinia necatrix]